MMIGITASLQSSRVQTYLTGKISAYLSEKLNAKVSVERVDIDFFNTLVLEGLIIEDQHRKNLASVSSIYTSIDFIDREKQIISIDKVSLEGLDLSLTVYKNEENLNLQFLIDAFSSGDTSDSSWNIDFESIELIDSKFSYKNENKTDSAQKFGVNYDDLELSNLNLALQNISFAGDTVFANIKNLRFDEKSGFKLEKLSGYAYTCGTELKLKNLYIHTPESDIMTGLSFHYESYDDYKDFLNKVIMKSSFAPSNINFSDIAYFAPDLEGINKNIRLTGDIKGTITALKARDIDIELGQNTRIKGDIDMSGLPVIEETFIQLKLDEFMTTKEDLGEIPVPPFNKRQFLEIPDNIKELGLIRFNGEFTGFYHDFVAYGNFTTKLGKISSDISLNYDEKSKKTSYSGFLALSNFDIGKYFDIKDMGAVTLKTKVKGSGFTKNEIDATVEGNIQSLVYNRYVYRDAQINGHIADKQFQGNLTVNDENLNMEFDGEVNFTESLPEFKFVSKITNARFAKLGLIDRDSSSLLSSNIIFDFKGSNPDNIIGNIIIKNLQYSEKSKKYNIHNVRLLATENGSYRNLKIYSDLLEAEINGKFSLAELPSTFNDHFSRIILQNNSTSKKKTTGKVQDFTYRIDIKNSQPITELFIQDLEISPNSSFKGHYNSINNTLDLAGEIDKFKAFGNTLDKFYIKASASNDVLEINTGARKLLLSDSVWVDRFKISADTKKDTLAFSINWDDNQNLKNEADIKGYAAFNTLSKFDVKLLPSKIYLADSLWTINPNNNIHVDSSTIKIDAFEFRSATQSVKVEGFVSKDPQHELLIGFDNFKLANLNPLTNRNGITLKGTINGHGKLSDIYNQFGFRTALSFTAFHFNGENFGDGSLISAWDNNLKAINLNGKFFRGNIPTIDFSGNYYPSREKENIDLKLTLEKFQLLALKNYTKDIAEIKRGIASGSINITGELEKPLLKGKILVQQGRFRIDYLNTDYSFTDAELIIENSWFGFDNITLNDSRGNKTQATGTIVHNNFNDINIDIVLDSKNFMVLNTTEEQNPLYFGTAFISGRTSISGFTNDLTIDISAKTEKGTQFNIPLYGSEEVTENSFITFVNKDTNNIKIKQDRKIDLSGINMNFELDVTPDAEVQLIFDPKIGDIIKGKGSGNLNLEINTLGKFNIFGQYTIKEGDYLFTLMNVVNKKFKVEQGGTINWNGDPYNANIDLKAIYALKASLYDLGIDTSNSKKRYPVNCILNLQNDLMTPDITFGINLPQADEDTRTKVQYVLNNNEEEINQQVFALLTLNRFIAPKSTQSSSHSVGQSFGSSTTSELLANQISNWLSQVSNEFDLGFNYRPGDEISNEEVELALSTQQFNDRLSVDGSVSNIKTAGTNNIVGDFNVEYKVSEDGRIRVKAFNRPNKSALLFNTNSNQQGIGIFYRKEFNTVKELFEEFKNKFRKKGK